MSSKSTNSPCFPYKLDHRAYLVQCAWCNSISIEENWITPNDLSLNNFLGRFSHSICPDCKDKHFE
ncbi:hypothetical protein [Candidatus Lokiarchaeum ossiferum]|uniref:hypothetical protein n=1 Tax=Candidatus Lokiarchaeum ossiferum TaxID=2951803 RepID=UPI00352CF3EF